MKDIDRLTETFTAIGVPFRRDKMQTGTDQIVTVDELRGGYEAFFVEFVFDADGTFDLASSGCYE